MMLRALLTGRWLIAFMVLPYALLWSDVAGSGGVLAALLVVALLLFYFACLDELHVQRLDETRLGFVRQRGRVDPEHATIAKYLFGALAKLIAIVLLFTQFWAGFVGLIVLTLIWISSLGTRRWQVKTLWAEILIPLCAIMLPIILIGFFASGLLTPADRLATVVGTAMLAGYLLLCAMRDEPVDRGDGLVTTPTLLGRMRSGLLFFAIAAVATTLTIRGASAIVAYPPGSDPVVTVSTAWPWSIAVFVAILSMFGVLLTAEREDSLAVGIWGTGAIATGVFFNHSVY